ncbi:MAG: EpsG family protein [Negativicutes bacterium]|nr:EpsG family protein [Negativicutes bacterium]
MKSKELLLKLKDWRFSLSRIRYFYFFALAFFPLFLLSSFRNGLGTDYYHYANAFKYPELFNSDVMGGMDVLFKSLFVTLPRLITHDEIIFFLLTSFVINFFFLKSIFKYSPIISLSILIYVLQFYFISYNVVRQFVVIALFLYFNVKYLNDKKFVSYYILVLILAQIHFSMYIMLFFPLLGSHNYKIITYWFIWIISFILFYMLSCNLINILRLFEYISYLSIISEKFSFAGEAISNFFLGLFKSNNILLLKNGFCVMFLFRLKYFKESNHIYWFNLFLFGVIIQNILVNLAVYAVRLSYVGDVALLMLVPLFVKSFKDKNIRVIIVLLSVLYFTFIFYYRFILIGENGVFKEDADWNGF